MAPRFLPIGKKIARCSDYLILREVLGGSGRFKDSAFASQAIAEMSCASIKFTGLGETCWWQSSSCSARNAPHRQIVFRSRTAGIAAHRPA